MIEKDILHIRWNTGQACINLKEYFPTSERRTRQLFRKLILLDDFQYEITEDLIHWLTVQLNSIDGSSLKMYANTQTQIRLYKADIEAAKAFRM